MHKPKEKKSTLKDLINKFVATKINQYLGKYLNNVKQEDLQASIGKDSTIILYNVQLRKDAFDDFRLPIEVHSDSKVNEIRCELKMLPLQVNIKVQGIRAILTPNHSAWSPMQWKDYKTSRLKDWEETQKHIFENLNLKTYKRQKIKMVANNINISIEDIIVYYRDTSALGIPCVIRLRIEKVNIDTTNNDFTKEQPSSSDLNTFRKITLNDLSLAIYAEVSEPGISFEDIRFSERMYLIKPCIVKICHTMLHKISKNKPTHTVKMEIPTLIFSINEVQRQFLEALIVNCNTKMQYRTYEEKKPVGNVIGNEKAWWNYLLETCKKDLGISIAGLVKNKQNMDMYIDCYKTCQEIIHAPWLPDRSETKMQALLEIEEKCSLDKLIWFRTLALYQLRIEAMSYVKARGNVRGKTHLGDLWDYYLNDFESLLGDPYKTVSEEQEIELNLEEKDELNRLLHMDKLSIVDSYLSGESSSRFDKIVDLSFNITLFTMFIQEVESLESVKCTRIPTAQCICYSCRRGNEKSPLKIFEESDAKQGKNMQTRDTVFSIIMVNHEGRSFDPKLVKEKTLMVIEAKIKGNLIVHRDLHIETTDDILVSNLCIWDPMILQEKNEIKNFKDKYGFEDDNDLLNMILKGKGEDFSLVNSLKFFMQEAGLVSELEFIIHCDVIFKKASQFCSCKKNYSSVAEQKQVFLNPSNKLCLHLTESELEKFQNSTNLNELFAKTYEFLNISVMPIYMRNCIRWIISSTIQFRNKKSSVKRSWIEKPKIEKSKLKINLKIKGKSSPIEVQFVNRKKRKFEDTKFEEPLKNSEITVTSDEVSLVLSTAAVQSLIKWATAFQKSFEYKKTFLSTLSACSSDMEYVKSVINNSKKSAQQLYYILKDKQKQQEFTKVNVRLDRVDIKLVETLVVNESIGFSEIKFEEFQMNVKVDHDKELAKNSKTRIDFKRDSKFYVTKEVIINQISVFSSMSSVIEITEFQLTSKDCIMNAHPYLVENIIDGNILHMKLHLKKELLSVLGLFSSLDFTPVKHYSKENIMKKNLQKKIFVHDTEKMQKKLLLYQDRHYQGKKLKDCIHCMLNYRKVCKNINFSIGGVDRKESGIELELYSNIRSNKPIKLLCPKLLVMIEERVFNLNFNIFSANFEKNKNIQIDLFKKMSKNKFDYNNISPIFSPIAETATPLVARVAEMYSESSIPLYLVLRSAQRKFFKIFDSNLWKKREKLFEKNMFFIKKNCVKKIKVPYGMRASKKNMKALQRNQEIYVCEDYMRVNLHSVVVNVKEAANDLDVLAVIASCGVFGMLYQKYLGALRRKILKKVKTIKVEVTLDELKVLFKYEKISLNFRVERLKMTSFSSFIEYSREKYRKNEMISNVSLISLKKIRAILEENIEFKVKSVNVIVSDIVHQKKQYSKLWKKTSGSIVKSMTINDVWLKSLLVRFKKPKLNLLAVPGCYNIEDSLLVKKNSFAIRIIHKTTVSKNSLQESLKGIVRPIGLYADGENIAIVIRQVQSLLTSSSKTDIIQIFSLPNFYKFTKDTEIIKKDILASIKIKRVTAFFKLKESKIGWIVLEKFYLNNNVNIEVFEGIIGHIEMISENSKIFQKYIILDENKRTSYYLNFLPKENSLHITVDNAQVIFLMKFIEEILELFKCIDSSIGKVEKNLEKSDSDGLKMTVVFTNSEIILPKSSTNEDNLTVRFARAKLNTFGKVEVDFKVPNPIQVIEDYDKEFKEFEKAKEIEEVSLQFLPDFESIVCMKLSVEITDLELGLNGTYIGESSSSDIIIYIPESPESKRFALKNKVEIQFSGAKFSMSLDRIQQIEEIIKTNMDEQLVKGGKKLIRSKNTKFKVKIASGGLSMSRWVTKPIPAKPLKSYREILFENQEKKLLHTSSSIEENLNNSMKIFDKDEEHIDIPIILTPQLRANDILTPNRNASPMESEKKKIGKLPFLQ